MGDCHALDFRVAGPEAIPELVALINAAYRGETSRSGWTTEADLLGGQRTDDREIRALMAADDALFLCGYREGDLAGCLHLARDGDVATLGMFSIRPGLQGAGLGKRFMDEAEAQARRRWGSRRMRLSVISLRSELIAFYARRGYRPTGEREPFPDDPRFGIPKVPELEFVVLEKPL